MLTGLNLFDLGSKNSFLLPVTKTNTAMSKRIPIACLALLGTAGYAGADKKAAAQGDKVRQANLSGTRAGDTEMAPPVACAPAAAPRQPPRPARVRQRAQRRHRLAHAERRDRDPQLYDSRHPL
jgi:hypothetical protein